MPYKRSAPISRHFVSLKFRVFSPKMDFFNSHGLFHPAEAHKNKKGHGLGLAIHAFGNVRSDPFENKFADQVGHGIRAHTRQAIKEN